MVTVLMGIILGGLISWIIAHFYYRKQEQKSPIPVIEEIKRRVEEVQKLAATNIDKKLRKELNKIIKLMGESYHKILSLVLPVAIDLQGLNLIYKSGDKEEYSKYLNDILPNLFGFHKNIEKFAKELEKLRSEILNMASYSQKENDS